MVGAAEGDSVGTADGVLVGAAVGDTVHPVHVKRQLAYHVGSVSQKPSRRAWAHWAGSNMSVNDESPMIA